MEKKIKIIIAIGIVVVLIIIGILFIFFLGTKSKCQCGNNDIENLVGTWSSIGSPRTETTYYSNGSWTEVYLDSPDSFNGTWELKNGSLFETRVMPDYTSITIEYGYRFNDDCNRLTLWNRAEENSGYVVVYMPFEKKC